MEQIHTSDDFVEIMDYIEISTNINGNSTGKEIMDDAEGDGVLVKNKNGTSQQDTLKASRCRNAKRKETHSSR